MKKNPDIVWWVKFSDILWWNILFEIIQRVSYVVFLTISCNTPHPRSKWSMAYVCPQWWQSARVFRQDVGHGGLGMARSNSSDSTPLNNLLYKCWNFSGGPVAPFTNMD